MKSRLLLVAFPIATMLTACQQATELTDYRRAEIAAEVELQHSQCTDAFRAADLNRALSYYRDSPGFAEVMDGELTSGYAAFEEYWRSTFANVASQTLRVSDLQTTVLAPDVVLVNEVATYTVTDTLGVTGPEVPYVYTAIWVLGDGEWKIQFAHQSSPTTENP